MGEVMSIFKHKYKKTNVFMYQRLCRRKRLQVFGFGEFWDQILWIHVHLQTDKTDRHILMINAPGQSSSLIGQRFFFFFKLLYDMSGVPQVLSDCIATRWVEE